MKISITSNYSPKDLAVFEAMVLEKWPEIELPLDIAMNPILAMSAGKVLGGLSFAHHAHPSRLEMSLWINSLIVTPLWRRKGVGAALVQAAMNTMQQNSELFVYTDVPNLYLGLAWRQVTSDSEGEILAYVKKSI